MFASECFGVSDTRGRTFDMNFATNGAIIVSLVYLTMVGAEKEDTLTVSSFATGGGSRGRGRVLRFGEKGKRAVGFIVFIILSHGGPEDKG